MRPGREKRELERSRVQRCDDGKYRWIYALSLYRDGSIFFLVWRIFFFIFAGIFGMVMLAEIGKGRMLTNLRFLGIFLLGMTAVVALGYLVYAAMMGGRYVVEFTMDENGLNHRQTDWQAERARKIGEITAMAGAAKGSYSVMGAGYSAQRTELYSDFSKVRRVKGYPRRGVIKVTGLLVHNQVYVLPEDYEFVMGYIVRHCPKLRNQ
ncbi:MAG: hypothetical protein IJQ46_00015 [Oscillospiraceae bacterium]|nr:hypothetical protein [Oscillospiraceae bacterium]